MRYLTVSSFGTALGLSGERLVVHEADGRTWETALSRLRTIRIEKKGISISTNLMLACAARGIRMFIVDWRGVGVVALSGLHQHAVVNIREAQFQAIHSSQVQSRDGLTVGECAKRSFRQFTPLKAASSQQR